MALKIITDSAADLPDSVKEKYHLHVIPTPVTINGTDYFDGETVFPKEFYERQRAGADISTYHINSHMFEEHFRPFAKEGDQVIYICFSTGLAGTMNAALLARKQLLEEYPGFDLTILDSKCAALGFGLLVYYALRMQECGAGQEEIIQAVEYHKSHMKHIFTVATLEYLYKGGRLSRTGKMAGDILNIRPILEVTEEGSLKAVEKVRGRNHSLTRCVERAAEKNPDLKNQIVGICHGDDYESLEKVKKMLEIKCGCTRFMESYVGCAIGAHTGTGIIGIVFLDETSPYLTKYKVIPEA